MLEHLWSAGPAEVKAVHRALGPPRAITLNTVQSTMERLYRKGLLRREKVSHAYLYSAQLTREALATQLMLQTLADLRAHRGEPLLVAFVDVAERAGEESLARLEALVAERLLSRGRKP